ESITQVTEKNTVVRDWSLRTHKAKDDSLKEEYISDLLEHVTSNVYQNNLKDLTRIWKQWDSDTRGIFIEKYVDIAHLIAMNVDEQLIQIRKKNEVSCVPWFSLQDLVQNHLDILKRIDLFALAIYELIIFPKVLWHIEVTVMDFFEKLIQGINPIPTILAETFRSLSSYKRKGEGHFIGCAQLFNAWIFSHFWKVELTHFHMISKTFAPLEAYIEKDWPKDVTE
ncbi:hypothetical protein Golax_025542, partial [Gossypium laxum]|nr:hypothetical protein [Gossypium laxum]